jgi:hypothetical protein
MFTPWRMTLHRVQTTVSVPPTCGSPCSKIYCDSLTTVLLRGLMAGGSWFLRNDDNRRLCGGLRRRQNTFSNLMHENLCTYDNLLDIPHNVFRRSSVEIRGKDDLLSWKSLRRSTSKSRTSKRVITNRFVKYIHWFRCVVATKPTV